MMHFMNKHAFIIFEKDTTNNLVSGLDLRALLMKTKKNYSTNYVNVQI